MVCLGLEPRVAEWKVQRNPLSYWGTTHPVTYPSVTFSYQDTSKKAVLKQIEFADSYQEEEIISMALKDVGLIWSSLFTERKNLQNCCPQKNQILAIALFPFSCSYAHYQLEAFVMVAWKLECKKSKIKCSWLFGASFLVQNPMAFFVDTFAVMSVVSWETQSTVQWSKSLIGPF